MTSPSVPQPQGGWAVGSRRTPCLCLDPVALRRAKGRASQVPGEYDCSYEFLPPDLHYGHSTLTETDTAPALKPPQPHMAVTEAAAWHCNLPKSRLTFCFVSFPGDRAGPTEEEAVASKCAPGPTSQGRHRTSWGCHICPVTSNAKDPGRVHQMKDLTHEG